MESNACARLRCSPMVRPRNTVVTGFVGGPAGGCWAAATLETVAARMTTYEIFIDPLGWLPVVEVVILSARALQRKHPGRAVSSKVCQKSVSPFRRRNQWVPELLGAMLIAISAS